MQVILDHVEFDFSNIDDGLTQFATIAQNFPVGGAKTFAIVVRVDNRTGMQTANQKLTIQAAPTWAVAGQTVMPGALSLTPSPAEITLSALDTKSVFVFPMASPYQSGAEIVIGLVAQQAATRSVFKVVLSVGVILYDA